MSCPSSRRRSAATSPAGRSMGCVLSSSGTETRPDRGVRCARGRAGDRRLPRRRSHALHRARRVPELVGEAPPALLLRSVRATDHALHLRRLELVLLAVKLVLWSKEAVRLRTRSPPWGLPRPRGSDLDLRVLG